jgi:predicted PhzF superfamily epimerase YddE/YHI9
MEVVKEAIRRITEEDLDVAIEKYDLADELSAKIDYGQINAFTENPFGGNPAAVCYLPYEKESAWMQLVARQFNLSETAFLVKRWASSKKVSLEGEKALLELDANGKSLKAVKRNLAPTGPKNEFDLRWFTPQVEVDLCGHATLAAAHILFTSGIVEDDIVIFHTRSGVLKAKKKSEDMMSHLQKGWKTVNSDLELALLNLTFHWSQLLNASLLKLKNCQMY